MFFRAVGTDTVLLTRERFYMFMEKVPFYGKFVCDFCRIPFEKAFSVVRDTTLKKKSISPIHIQFKKGILNQEGP